MKNLFNEKLGSKSLLEFCRFVIIGILATVIHYSIYYIMQKGEVSINISYTIGYGISFIFNFILSSYFTFKVKPDKTKGIKFMLAHFINYSIQMLLLNIIIGIGIASSVAGIISIVVAIPINFIMVKKVFKGTKKKNDSADKREKIKSILYNNGLHIIVGGTIGGIVFILIYGIKVLDITNVEWLYNAGDLTQHQIGWEFFRRAEWSFPLGYMENYAYPFGVGITYTDSIPIIAIFFKFFEGILPKDFQYFGGYMLFSFMMQGVIISIILKKYTKSIILIAISVICFVTTPIMLRRVFIHTALASHWIILLAILIWVYRKKFLDIKLQVILWGSLNILCVMIHPYFVPMIFTIMCGCLILNIIEHGKVKELFIIPIMSILGMGISFWIIGGFTGESLPAYGFGKFSMNLNALFNPNGWSKYIPNLENAFTEQYEGLQYIGLGFIILIPILLVLILCNLKNIKLKDYVNSKNIIGMIPYVLVVVVLLFISVSNIITLNGEVLLEYEMPKLIRSILEIFRSTGRLFWPVVYGLMLGMIVLLIKILNGRKNIMIIIMISITTIQVADMSDVLKTTRDFYKSEQKFDNILKSDIWDEVGEKFEHIKILPAYTSTYSYFAEIATKYDMTMNIGSFARAPYDNIYNLVKEVSDDLIKGEYDKETVYIIQHFGLLNEIMTNDEKGNFTVIKVDNTDNCFALINKEVKINFSNYPEMKIFTGEDFKKIEFDAYMNYLQQLSSDEILITATSGDMREFLDENKFEGLQTLGLFEDGNMIKENSSYASVLMKSEEGYLHEVYSNDIAYIDYPNGFKIDKHNLKRVININSSSRENAQFANILLDGFQHSIDAKGLNFIVYNMEDNQVKSIVNFNPHKEIGEVMFWN